MPFFGALIILLFCLPAVFAKAHLVRPLLYFAGVALLLGASGYIWPIIMPRNLMIDHPWIANTPLHPQMSVFFGGVCLLFALGLFLALGCRSLFIYLRVFNKS